MKAKFTAKDTGKMEKLINAYFDKQDANKNAYSVPGLAAALGFVSRQSLHDYQKKPEFKRIIKNALLRIEAHYNERLAAGKGSQAGQIFLLKSNYGYKDQPDVKVKHTGNITVVTGVPGPLGDTVEGGK